MLERQNVELVPLINISGEESVSSNSNLKIVAKSKHSLTLDFIFESTGLF